MTSVTDRGIAAQARELPGEAQRGRRPAFDAQELDSFVRLHHERLVRLARLVCRDSSEAADAVQTALERAWRRRDALTDPAKLRPWLDRIVVREAIRQDSRRHRILARLHDALGDGRVDPVDPHGGLGHELAALRTAYETLSAEQRAAIALHLHLGYSVAETAEIVGAPVETVRSRLRLGRQRLRDAMREDHS